MGYTVVQNPGQGVGKERRGGDPLASLTLQGLHGPAGVATAPYHWKSPDNQPLEDAIEAIFSPAGDDGARGGSGCAEHEATTHPWMVACSARELPAESKKLSKTPGNAREQSPRSPQKIAPSTSDVASPQARLPGLGDWTEDEHQSFLLALKTFCPDAEARRAENGRLRVGLGKGVAHNIAKAIGTRTAVQVRSHAQKYFRNQARDKE
eukprot:606334-Hanusia_phi.AAC.2